MSKHACVTDSRDRIAAVLAETGSVSETARRLGIDRGTVRKYGRKADAASALTEEEKIAKRRALVVERDALREVAGEKAFRSFLAGLFREACADPFKPVVAPKPPAARKAHVRYPLLHLSDWHFEEVVRSESVMGLNEYDAEIACRRVWRVVRAFSDWKRTQVAGGRYKFPELVVALNGDLLTGTLHGLERHSSAPNVIRATLACGRLVALALRDLAAEFPAVRVVGTVGNHGRLPDDKKMPTKDPSRSFDYMAYAIAAELLRETKHVRFTIPDSYGAVYEVGGHTVYQGHGNFVRQQLGIVGYGMRRFVSNLAANMSAAGRSLKYAVFGHFHQANTAEFAGVTTFIGPSLIGTQEYAFLSGGAVNRPAQQCYVFDRDLGHVSTETLYGEGPGYEGAYRVGFDAVS